MPVKPILPFLNHGDIDGGKATRVTSEQSNSFAEQRFRLSQRDSGRGKATRVPFTSATVPSEPKG